MSGRGIVRSDFFYCVMSETGQIMCLQIREGPLLDLTFVSGCCLSSSVVTRVRWACLGFSDRVSELPVRKYCGLEFVLDVGYDVSVEEVDDSLGVA